MKDLVWRLDSLNIGLRMVGELNLLFSVLLLQHFINCFITTSQSIGGNVAWPDVNVVLFLYHTDVEHLLNWGTVQSFEEVGS